ncbi:MAG TPA: RNA polymerase sigma factor [Pyrinomonadaceae bacterium]|jgi:RNA polymerase sigma-70 factor (ECF subfamily)|nr:RNA polymerase sigma factor [Pyrinomonadaceae bacterium]
MKSDLNDSELLRSMLAGDEEALSVLYRRRQGAVYRFALQMSGSKTVAEDVTQEVFLFLMRDGRVFDPAKGSVSAFLLGVARNYVLRRLRVEQQLAPLGDDFDDDVPVLHASIDICPLEDLTRAETIESVRRAVLSLPSKYREVVVLCELQDISYGETAEILGCAIGTVRSRLHRARALLLAKLRPAAEAEDADSATVKSARCFA